MVKARVMAVAWHNYQKQSRLKKAELDAAKTLNNISITPPILDLAIAMLYLGEGKKTDTTSLSNSEPMVLQFFLAVLSNNYSIDREKIICALHLRADQDKDENKKYWSGQLGIPLENFKYIYFDKRTKGRPSYKDYHGVCVIHCGIAIQRKLIYLYNQFCHAVIKSVGS